MLTYLLVVLLASSSRATPAATGVTGNSSGPKVTDQAHSVTYHGSVNNSVESFLNIRFGKDTSGQAQFTPPKPYTYPEGAASPQSIVAPPGSAPGSSNITNISEDCLTLRVDRVPKPTADALLPVMVFLYGGGWTVEEIFASTYKPTGLLGNAAKSGFPVVYAAIK